MGNKFEKIFYSETCEIIDKKDYKKEIHRDKIYCPACKQAKLRNNIRSGSQYFSKIPSSDHKSDCDFDSNDNTYSKSYIASLDMDDILRLHNLTKSFLIDVNSKNNGDNKKNKNPYPDKGYVNKNEKNETKKIQKVKYLPRRNIDNLYYEKIESDQKILIYGEAVIKRNEDWPTLFSFKSLKNNNIFNLWIPKTTYRKFIFKNIGSIDGNKEYYFVVTGDIKKREVKNSNFINMNLEDIGNMSEADAENYLNKLPFYCKRIN